MKALGRVATLLATIGLPAGAMAQTAPENAPNQQAQQNGGAAQQTAVCGQPVVDQPQTAGSVSKAGMEKKQEVPVAKEVGAAAAGTAGQIGGAAVAGPIGAAVGGVVAGKVGEAVGSLVKKKKKKPDQADATSQAQPPAGSGGSQLVCVTPSEPQAPQR